MRVGSRAYRENVQRCLAEAQAIVMWRCEQCGKWSHAHYKPKQHKRFVYDGSVTTTEFSEEPNGDFVQCGPFAGWIARPVPAEYRSLNGGPL
jgi:hypothetical protein